MIPRIILFLSVLLWSATAEANQVTVGVYADDLTSCNIIDNTPGLLTVWVMMSAADGATAVQFAAPKPECMAVTYLSDVCWPCLVGNSQIGTAVGFGTCVTGFFQVIGINYFAQALTEPCCLYPVIPDPHVASGQIEAVDCNNNLFYPWGEVSTVNGDSSCPCGYPVAVEETTWGKVKSLYME